MTRPAESTTRHSSAALPATPEDCAGTLQHGPPPDPPAADRRPLRHLFVLLIAAVPAVALLALAVGPAGIGLPLAWQDPTAGAILRLRAARAFNGFTTGASLAVAGVVFQTLLRNPLADPYVLGVSGGAALGAALVILFLPVGILLLPGGAFLGGILTLALVYRLARVGGRASPYGLILSGVIVSAVCNSLLMFLVAIAPREGLHNIQWWMLGSLEPDSIRLLRLAGLLSGATVALLWRLAPALNALALGDDLAHALGISPRRLGPATLAAATLLASLAVGLAGLIGFVGLIVPHAARALVGGDHRRLLPASALIGGLFLVLCDTLGRTLMAPRVIPIGVITALIGGPVFLAILVRRRKGGWLA